MALTDIQIKALKPQDKKYSVSDGRGLILEVRPNGAKYWIVRYWIKGKEKRKHLGSYPEMSTKEARIKAAEAKTDTLVPQKDKVLFGEIVAEWLEKRMLDKKESYIRSIKMRLRKYILPEFEKLSLNEITSGQILKLCRKLEDRGTIERQLAHVERNSVRAAYNHAEYLDERRKMMQFWADYLDKLEADSPL